MPRIIFALVVCVAAFGFAGSEARAAPEKQSVRVLYVIPADRQHNPAYEDQLRNTALALQMWYYCHLNGKTFRLNNPIVEVKKSTKNAAWFKENPVRHGQEKKYDAWHNARNELTWLGANPNDQNYVWFVFVDAPGDQEAGTERVSILFEKNIQGLMGRFPAAKPEPVNLWIGVAGHELGHGFGLPHPPNNSEQHAIMQLGFRRYPNCYLTRDDEVKLHESPFFFEGREKAQFTTEVRAYGGGCFVKVDDRRWYELKTGSTTVYWFDKQRENAEFIYLRDGSRKITVALPKNSDVCFFAYDWQRTFTKLYTVKK